MSCCAAELRLFKLQENNVWHTDKHRHTSANSIFPLESLPSQLSIQNLFQSSSVCQSLPSTQHIMSQARPLATEEDLVRFANKCSQEALAFTESDWHGG